MTLPPLLIPETQSLLFFLNLSAVLPVHSGTLALTLLLILLLENPT
jgi:hypothetical protein